MLKHSAKMCIITSAVEMLFF